MVPPVRFIRGFREICNTHDILLILDESLILLTCGTDDNVIRWIPPLVIDEAQLSEALAIFGRALDPD